MSARPTDLEDAIDAVVQSYDGSKEIDNLDSAALPNKRAVIEAYDHIKPALYVGFGGRGIVKISDLGLGGGVILREAVPAAEPELEPVERSTKRVRTADGREGTAEVGPDGRLFITFDDGRPGFAHSDEVTVVDGAAPVTG